MRIIPQATYKNKIYLVTMLYKCSKTYSNKFWPAFLNLVNMDEFLYSDQNH